jgi:hypothetical protein
MIYLSPLNLSGFGHEVSRMPYASLPDLAYRYRISVTKSAGFFHRSLPAARVLWLHHMAGGIT